MGVTCISQNLVISLQCQNKYNSNTKIMITAQFFLYLKGSLDFIEVVRTFKSRALFNAFVERCRRSSKYDIVEFNVW